MASCAQITQQVKILTLIIVEKQVLKAVANKIKQSYARNDPTLRVQKETEGVFDLTLRLHKLKA